ncbi:hypothetical protein XENOCAPTIV_015448, partial [Xenoophorus captivus]
VKTLIKPGILPVMHLLLHWIILHQAEFPQHLTASPCYPLSNAATDSNPSFPGRLIQASSPPESLPTLEL